MSNILPPGGDPQLTVIVDHGSLPSRTYRPRPYREAWDLAESLAERYAGHITVSSDGQTLTVQTSTWLTWEHYARGR